MRSRWSPAVTRQRRERRKTGMRRAECTILWTDMQIFREQKICKHSCHAKNGAAGKRFSVAPFLQQNTGTSLLLEQLGVVKLIWPVPLAWKHAIRIVLIWWSGCHLILILNQYTKQKLINCIKWYNKRVNVWQVK